VFLALAVAVANSFRRGLRLSKRAAAFTVAPILGGILAAASINAGVLSLDLIHVELWFVLFAALTVSGAAMILHEKTANFGEPYITPPRGLRIALLVHTLVVLFFGLNMFFLPVIAQNFWPWRVSPVVMQGLGGFFLGSTIGTTWLFRQRDLNRIKAVLPAYAVFTGLVLVAVLLDSAVVASESPGPQVTISWLMVYIYVTAYAGYYTLNRAGGATKGGVRAPVSEHHDKS
jgi:hypothetical protein